MVVLNNCREIPNENYLFRMDRRTKLIQYSRSSSKRGYIKVKGSYKVLVISCWLLVANFINQDQVAGRLVNLIKLSLIHMFMC